MHAVIHYAEIGTKGENRAFFEKKLVENISTALGKGYNVKRLYGRIVVESKKADAKRVKNNLENIPGIAYFSFSVKARLNIGDMKKNALLLAQKYKEIKSIDANLLDAKGVGQQGVKQPKTFRIDTKRSNKNFPYNSLRINEMLAGDIIRSCKLKVDLTKPDLTIYVEVAEKNAFIYAEKIKGIGGLPVGTSSKAVCLLSGGIDSPVAAYSMMRRGCKIVFAHFCQRYEKNNKIEKLVKVLNRYQNTSKLYMIPFQKAQKEIIKCVPAKYRMIAYRITMLKIAEQIARKENAKSFVTGDNLGQVASQTIENMAIIHKSTGYPVFAPLIGYDKNEIISIAEKIGTFKLSIMPYADCCSYMIAEHPSTKTDAKALKGLEKKMKMPKIIKDALREKTIMKI